MKARAGVIPGTSVANLYERIVNPSQMFECEINALSIKVCLDLRDMNNDDAFAYLQSYIRRLSVEQADHLVQLDSASRIEYLDELRTGRSSLRVHQPPFFGTISLEETERLFTDFKLERVKFDNMENRAFFSSMYYMRLRHEPESKMSTRSAKHLSMSGVPAKNNRGVRAGTEHHSSTPIRLGEQELQNLMIPRNPEALQRFLRNYAVDDISRAAMIQHQTLQPNPYSDDPVTTRSEGMTRPVAGLDAMLRSIGMRLDLSPEEQVTNDQTEVQSASSETATMELEEDGNNES